MFKKLLKRFSSADDSQPEEQQASSEPATPIVTETPAEKTESGAETGAAQGKLTYIESATPAEPTESAEPLTDDQKEEIKNRVTDMMRTIFDPEIPVNVYDIGLIYKIEPQDDGILQLTMTLTTPNCPAAGILPGEIESKARSVDGVRDVEFELTFDPPWNPEMMSEGARLELGMM
jgi:FeS assembly SUF system protein